MARSVHDNHVYLQIVDHEAARIVLHTWYPPAPDEYTDIVFEGVVVHHFERQAVGPDAQIILFDVYEGDAADLLAGWESLLAVTKNYGWPVQDYTTVDDLVARLTADGARCYLVHGVIGLDGFVFAKRMKFVERAAKARTIDSA